MRVPIELHSIMEQELNDMRSERGGFMGRCFIIQPFDEGGFDKRFDAVFAPAIRNAKMEPYRVDRDPSMSVPITGIESEIRRATICLADITVDNPNVWFEVGFAIAVQKEIILVCSEERKSRFPFDIQHRSIIRYKTESPQDFESLTDKITKRALALLNKAKEMGTVSKFLSKEDQEGLVFHEIAALVSIMQNSLIAGDNVSGNIVREDMSKNGLNRLATSMAIRSLLKKGMIESNSDEDINGYSYPTFGLTETGEQWMMDNQEKLELRVQEEPEDELPF